MNQKLTQDEPEKTSINVLLPDNLDFLITRTGESHSRDLNVTYRWPRKADNEVTSTIATTTIDAQNLSSLRVENINEQFFIMNDKSGAFGDPVKLSVQSEEIGHRIVKAIIEEFSPKATAELKKDLLDVPSKYWRINNIAESFAPLIMISCAVLISISVSYWLVLK